MRKAVLKTLAFLIAVSGLATIPIGDQETAQASHATFNQQFLIADNLFTDTDSMSVAEIQQWLEDNGGTLLANWVDDVDMRRPSDNCIVHHATGMTAAEVIYEAAHTWGAQVYDSSGCAIEGAYWSDPAYSDYTLPTVSPRVLLVTLQKEQSLISANGSYSSNYQDYQTPTCCNSNEYKLARATGYGVPDSGNINEKYLGFYNQINWAAWQLRYNFERSGGNTSWDEVGYLTYAGPFTEGTHPACSSCTPIARSGYYTIDGSPLYMGSRATASLYYYTPHTYPGYFGNYNFVQFYTDWFGTTTPNGYKWEIVEQRSFTDSSKTQGRSIQDLVPGDRVYLQFKAKNVGSIPWTNTGIGAVWAGTEGPKDRDSAFCDSTWLNCRRPARMTESVVDVNETGTFEFWYNVPLNHKAGSTPERFNLLASGITWMPDRSMNFFTTVQPASRSWERVSQHSWTDSSKTQTRSIQDLLPGDRVYIAFVARNTGNVKWTNTGTGAIWAGTEGPKDRNSDFCDSTWLNCRRPARMKESEVLPGDTGTFEFWYNVPSDQAPGSTPERFNLLSAGIAWLPDVGMNFFTVVEEPTLDWDLVSQHAYTDNTKTTPRSIKNLNPGDRVYIAFVAENTGNVTWHNTGTGALWAGTEGPKDRNSDFCDSTWLNCRRPARMSQSSVAPGDNGTFEFWYDVPASQPSGTYKERFNILSAGVQWLPDSGMNFFTVVL